MNNRKQDIIGILLFILGIFILLSFLSYSYLETPMGLSLGIAQENLMGVFGIYVSYYCMKYFFGWGTLSLPIIIILIGYTLFMRKKWDGVIRISNYLLGLGILVSILIAWFGSFYGGLWRAEYPGLGGYLLWSLLNDFFGYYPTTIIIVVYAIILGAGFLKISIYSSVIDGTNKIKNVYFEIIENKRIKNLINKPKSIEKKLTERTTLSNNSRGSEIDTKDDLDFEFSNHDDKKTKENELNNNFEPDDPKDIIESISDDSIEIDSEKEVVEGQLDKEEDRKAKYLQFKLPTLEYLHEPIELGYSQSEDELKLKANQLVHSLDTYGVSGKVVRISPGPIITLFEIEPAEGVRVNKFTNLADDLARVMKAQRVRIIAPIPGSNSVGIELPNENPSTVFLKNIINSEQYIKSKSKLSISLGKTTTGEAYVFDLGKMPHLLVAGATGAGKSVCINTIIVSILYKAKPDEVKFILIDPKKLELATYKSLVGYHLVTAPNIDEYVMTTAENSVAILDSAIIEMERRFQVFADARVRNIAEYHNRRLQNKELESIPYLVVLIDELADLMMTSGRAIEEPITRLAQKARAVGIHLVVATQRPSVDVITGLIKSNFPARIAFQVSSKVDSRTIIDQMGAEKLLGKGDMLFLLPGTASPVRLHNAFITLEEIEKVMKHIEKQPKPEKVSLPEIKKAVNSDDEFVIDNNKDELLYEAAKLVTQSQQASVSLLQRKFRIGYSRAGRLIDELELLGIVSGYSGSKARTVLVDESYLENIF